jgi:hypothetical protein
MHESKHPCTQRYKRQADITQQTRVTPDTSHTSVFSPSSPSPSSSLGTKNSEYQRGGWHISGWAGDRHVNGSDIDPFANTDWWAAVSPLY